MKTFDEHPDICPKCGGMIADKPTYNNFSVMMGTGEECMLWSCERCGSKTRTRCKDWVEPPKKQKPWWWW